jgi:homoprotocatechuate degradation regulator HpaR
MSPKRPRDTGSVPGGMSAAKKKAGANGAADDNALANRTLPMRAFSKSLPMELLRAREAVMRRFRPELRNHGVTEQQWRILRALAHSGPLEVSELAEVTCLLAPSLSRILPDMEARQLIGRKQADADLRRSVISLERKGLRLIAMHAPAAERIYDAIAKQFGSERLSQLFTLLHELEQSLEAQNDNPTDSRSRSRPRAPAARRVR